MQKKKQQEIINKRNKRKEKNVIENQLLEEESIRRMKGEDSETFTKNKLKEIINETQQHSYEITGAKLSLGGKPNLLTTSFAKDTDEMVQLRKLEATKPINISLRNKDIIAPILPSLDFPKRPKWHRGMSKQELELNEENEFKIWLKSIHEKYTHEQLCPFEHNLEVWRQLWRVLEKSEIILLVADIRNPLLHIPRDLYNYVIKVLELPLVIALTKCDLVDIEHIQKWKKFLTVMFPFATFVEYAGKAQHTMGKGAVGHRRKMLTGQATKAQVAQLSKNADYVLQKVLEVSMNTEKNKKKEEETIDDGADDDPYSNSFTHKDVRKIGIVGHPNCGKSSLLNAIMGKHVVSVSRQPGHTKKWQTHFVRRPNDWDGLSKVNSYFPDSQDSNIQIVAQLCDSPGLIFPVAWIEDDMSDTISEADQRPRHIYECCGLYPVSQIREPFSAVRYLAERLPIERMYNLKIDPDDYGTIEELSPYGICGALADQKGFTMAKGGGAPDFHRAGQMILYDVIDGVILLKFEPPEIDRIPL